MLDDNHRSYLLGRFRHLDGLFSELMGQLVPAEDGRLFRTHVPDASPAQRRALAEYVARLRATLQRFLQAQGLRDDGEPVSALWAFRVGMSFARTAAEELQPAHVLAYGELDAAAAGVLDALVAELLAEIQRVDDYLDRDSGTPPAAGST